MRVTIFFLIFCFLCTSISADDQKEIDSYSKMLKRGQLLKSIEFLRNDSSSEENDFMLMNFYCNLLYLGDRFYLSGSNPKAVKLLKQRMEDFQKNSKYNISLRKDEEIDIKKINDWMDQRNTQSFKDFIKPFYIEIRRFKRNPSQAYCLELGFLIEKGMRRYGFTQELKGYAYWLIGRSLIIDGSSIGKIKVFLKFYSKFGSQKTIEFMNRELFYLTYIEAPSAKGVYNEGCMMLGRGAILRSLNCIESSLKMKYNEGVHDYKMRLLTQVYEFYKK